PRHRRPLQRHRPARRSSRPAPRARSHVPPRLVLPRSRHRLHRRSAQPGRAQTGRTLMPQQFVSRAGLKLDHALSHFAIDVTGHICADLCSNTGGFVDCLLQRGAAKVYAIDAGYGALDWKLRKDPRVIVMERTNAMHAELPEKVGVVTIDVAWTRQKHILPPARRMLAADGWVVTLIKPHYEADPAQLRKGILAPE